MFLICIPRKFPSTPHTVELCFRWGRGFSGQTGGLFPQIFSFFYNNFFSFFFLPLGCFTHSLVTRPNTRLLAQWSLHPSYLPQQFFFTFSLFFFSIFAFLFFLPPEGDFRRSLPKVAPITTTTTYPRWWFLICIPPNPLAPLSTHLHKRPRAPTPCLLPLTDWQKVCGVGLTKTPYIFSVSFLLL